MHLSTDMGMFAIWVWPAYGCTVLVFAINYLIAVHEQRTIRRQCSLDDMQETGK